MKKENKKLATELLENEKRLQKQRLEEHFTSVKYITLSKEELDEILPYSLIQELKDSIHD